jgi:hypothetical protein
MGRGETPDVLYPGDAEVSHARGAMFVDQYIFLRNHQTTRGKGAYIPHS